MSVVEVNIDEAVCDCTLFVVYVLVCEIPRTIFCGVPFSVLWFFVIFSSESRSPVVYLFLFMFYCSGELKRLEAGDKRSCFLFIRLTY